jgi:DNA-directed RNA polymerase subunit beta'
VAVPTQDMVLGSYYLTMERENDLGAGMSFKDSNEAVMAYENKCVSLHAKIKIRLEEFGLGNHSGASNI